MATTQQDGRVGPAGSDASLGQLVATATRDMSLLVRQELDLAKTELRQQALSAGLGAGFLIGAAALGVFALFALTIAIAEGITSAGIDKPWAYVITAGIYLLIAGLLGIFALGRLSKLSPPKRTIETVKDDITWIKKPTVAPPTSGTS